MQTSAQYPQLFENAVTKGVVKSLKTRSKFRNVVITLAEGDLKEVYLDDEGGTYGRQSRLRKIAFCKELSEGIRIRQQRHFRQLAEVHCRSPTILESRKKYSYRQYQSRSSFEKEIQVAKKRNDSVRCFVMTTSIEHAKHNNKFRELTDPSHIPINEIIINSYV
ncbi:uncharacterized protein [Temnothorax nylanderi]|uniref:uncharacterized protein n=1 Tax=Temnothorax nylanderi TaxID=102681 RepID=UPI003A8ADAE5